MYYAPKKTKPDLSAQRVISVQRSRFNPLRGFDPAKLVNAIEQFDAGYLGPLARIIDALEQRDDTWKTAARKTKSSVSRCQHQVLIVEGHEGEPAAEAHKATLEKFWSRIRVTDAFKRNQEGGRSLLVKQMMDAVGSVYACHEIVWRPLPNGELSATFIRMPLWMFENTTGRLRYLPTDGAVYGDDMPEAEWLVTVGDGVGIACAVACMAKRLAFEDWLIYSERCGMPGLHAQTPSKRDTDDWRDLVRAVGNYGREWNLVTNKDVELTPIQLSTAGTLPYPDLVAYAVKAIAALWRGADLSTISGEGGDSTGASLQGDESDLLEQDACEMISETLQAQVERHVIRMVHGDEEPLAYIQIMPEARPNLDQEMKIDNHLVTKGVKLSKNEALRRYQRTEVDPTDPEDSALTAPAAAEPAAPGISLANEALSGNLKGASAALAAKKDKALAANARTAVLKALDADLKPMRDRLAKAMQAPDDKLQAELQAVLADMPALFEKVSASGQLDKALEETITATLFNGFAEQAAARKGASRA